MARERKKIFIPLSINETVSGYSFFLSNGKVALMLVYWVFVTLGTVVLKGILMSPFALFIYLSLAFTLFIFIVRYKVLEERRLQKLYNDQITLNPSKMSPFWKIINIDSNGIIRYDLNKAGMIIRIDKSTIVGRDEGFREFNHEARANMLRYLFEKGYTILYINTEHQHNLREKVSGLYSLANTETEIVRDIFSAELSFVVANSYLFGIQESEYYLVLTSRYSQVKELERDCKAAMSLIQYTAVSNVHTLNKEEVINLIKHINGINYLDAETLIVQEIQTPVKDKINFKITKEYDKLGVEKFNIEIPDEEDKKKVKKKSKMFNRDIKEEESQEQLVFEADENENKEEDIFSLLDEVESSNNKKSATLKPISSNNNKINKNIEFKEENEQDDTNNLLNRINESLEDDFSDLE